MDYMRIKGIEGLDFYEAGLMRQFMSIYWLAAWTILPNIGAIILQLNAMKNFYDRPKLIPKAYEDNGGKDAKLGRRIGLALSRPVA